MKNGKKSIGIKNDLFPDLQISINPELQKANKSGSAKKIAAAKKILAKVNFNQNFILGS
jgi:hypothetical protein